MAAIAGMAVVTGIIAACAGPLYYCKETWETRENSQVQRTRDDEGREREKRVYCIEISTFHKDSKAKGHEVTSNSDSTECDTKSQEHAEGKENDLPRSEVEKVGEFDDTNASPRSAESQHGNLRAKRVAPIKPPRAARKVGDKVNAKNMIQSKSLVTSDGDRLIGCSTNELSYQTCQQEISSDTSSSVECGKTEIVKVQIERNPYKSISTNNETDLLNLHSKNGETSNAVPSSTDRRSDDFVGTVSNGETSYLTLPNAATKARMSRTIDASTSTKISLRGFELEELHDEISTNEEQLEIVKCSRRECGNSVLREMLSLVSHEKDAEIEVTGFTLNRGALLRLMENAGGETTRCFSFLKQTQEEEEEEEEEGEPQNVSIRIRKYRSRRRRSSFKWRNKFFDSSSSRTTYRKLPSKSDDTKLFSRLSSRSRERSSRRSSRLNAGRSNVDNRANEGNSYNSVTSEQDESSSYLGVHFSNIRDSGVPVGRNKVRERRNTSNFFKFLKRTKLFKILR